MICTKCNKNKTGKYVWCDSCMDSKTPVKVDKKIVPLKIKEEQFNILVHHNKFFSIFHNIVDKYNLK